MLGEKPPTMDQAVTQALSGVDGPIALDEVIRYIMAIRPSKAKDPAKSIRNMLRSDYVGTHIVFLDQQTILPLNLAWRGVQLRHQFSRLELKHDVLLAMPTITSVIGHNRKLEDITLIDQNGQPIPVRIRMIEQKSADLERHLLGTSTYTTPAFD